MWSFTDWTRSLPSKTIRGMPSTNDLFMSFVHRGLSPIRTVTILHCVVPPNLLLPDAILFAKSNFNWDSSPHLKIFYYWFVRPLVSCFGCSYEASLPTSMKWVWPFVSSLSFFTLGLILGYIISFSGATPIRVTFFL